MMPKTWESSSKQAVAHEGSIAQTNLCHSIFLSGEENDLRPNVFGKEVTKKSMDFSLRYYINLFTKDMIIMCHFC